MLVVAALFASGCGSTERVVETVTQEATESTTASSPTQSSKPKRSKARRAHRRLRRVAAVQTPRFASCDANIRARTGTTSCAFALNVFVEYWTQGDGRLQAYSATTDSTFEVRCARDAGQVRCINRSGADVRFPESAVDAYTTANAKAFERAHDMGPEHRPITRSFREESGPGDVAPEPVQPAPEPTAPSEDSPPLDRRIPNYDNGRGYPVPCVDGMWSKSGGIQGACSGHGGVAG